MSNHTIYGMIHVPALPGSYKNSLTIQQIKDFCLLDAKFLIENGIDHLFIENFFDVPFPKSNVKPHVIAAITSIIELIQSKYDNAVTFGINILRNDALSALGIATLTNSKAIRVNVLSHARLTDQGIIEGCAHELKTYSVQLNSSVEIWADVDVKHSVPLSPIPIEQSVNDLIERGGADKIIFSGPRTGQEVDKLIISDLIGKKIIKPEQAVIGSGINTENINDYKNVAHNFIVGSSLKKDDKIYNQIDPNKVIKLVSSL